MKLVLVIIFSLFSFKSYSAELTGQTYLDGLGLGFKYLYQGSYLQFTAKNNAYGAAVAAPALWYSFEEDKRITNHAMTKKVHGYMNFASDITPFLSMPFLTGAFYTYGIKKDNQRAVQFATETFATLYLSLIESSVLSLADIHERPNSDRLSKWETQFRAKSSFPSGHVIPYITLALKTYQFYGPYYAIVPATFFVATAMQRVRDGKHYFSDIVGAVFVTAFASEGVRKAGGYAENHPTFKAIFEHDVQIGYSVYRGAAGPRITFSW